MRRSLLAALLLAAPLALAQQSVEVSLETDRAVYAYGEPIVVTYRATNTGAEPFAWWGSSSCLIGLVMDSLVAPGEWGGCTADDRPWFFEPGGTWAFTFEIRPNEHGVPEDDGQQTVTAFLGGGWQTEGVHPASATFSAPRYLGGRLIVALAAGYTLEDVADIAAALNAVVIEEWPDAVVWEISGTTLQEAVAAYAEDPRFTTFEVYRELYFSEVYATSAEGGATPPAGLILSAPYPNPAAGAATLTLTPPRAGAVTVGLYDLLGRRLAVLHDGPLAAGATHPVALRTGGLPAGVYVVRAAGDGFTAERRVTVAR